jgi:hypothetical protein
MENKIQRYTADECRSYCSVVCCSSDVDILEKQISDQVQTINDLLEERSMHLDMIENMTYDLSEAKKKGDIKLDMSIDALEGIESCISNPRTKYPEIIDYVYKKTEETLLKIRG